MSQQKLNRMTRNLKEGNNHKISQSIMQNICHSQNWSTWWTKTWKECLLNIEKKN